MTRMDQTVLMGVYAHLDAALEGMRRLKAAGDGDFQVFMPVPRHEVEHELDRGSSPIRIYTLTGGLLGLLTGWAVTVGSTLHYPLIVGGKPYISFPAFGVVSYILTILFGALFTVLGLYIHARIPQVRPPAAYDDRLSSDHFGIQVICDAKDVAKVEEIFRATGAVEVRRVEA